jgi:hypothetical protein
MKSVAGTVSSSAVVIGRSDSDQNITRLSWNVIDENGGLERAIATLERSKRRWGMLGSAVPNNSLGREANVIIRRKIRPYQSQHGSSRFSVCVNLERSPRQTSRPPFCAAEWLVGAWRKANPPISNLGPAIQKLMIGIVKIAKASDCHNPRRELLNVPSRSREWWQPIADGVNRPVLGPAVKIAESMDCPCRNQSKGGGLIQGNTLPPRPCKGRIKAWRKLHPPLIRYRIEKSVLGHMHVPKALESHNRSIQNVAHLQTLLFNE